jgi:hypothetical protein
MDIAFFAIIEQVAQQRVLSEARNIGNRSFRASALGAADLRARGIFKHRNNPLCEIAVIYRQQYVKSTDRRFDISAYGNAVSIALKHLPHGFQYHISGVKNHPFTSNYKAN